MRRRKRASLGRTWMERESERRAELDDLAISDEGDPLPYVKVSAKKMKKREELVDEVLMRAIHEGILQRREEGKREGGKVKLQLLRRVPSWKRLYRKVRWAILEFLGRRVDP